MTFWSVVNMSSMCHQPGNDFFDYGRTEVVKFFEDFCIFPSVISDVLVNGDDGASLDHKDIMVIISWVSLVIALVWDNVFSDHVRAQGST